MSILTRPQGRIPIGYAMVGGQRVPVALDLEWDRYFAVLTERAGGTVAPSNIVQYIQTTVAPSVVLDSSGDESGDQIFILQNTTVSGGGSGSTYGTATIDFSTGANEASVAVIGQAGILADSKPRAFIMADDTSVDHTASDHRYAQALIGLTCGTPTAGVGFTIYGRCLDKINGNFSLRWEWA